MTSLLSSSWSSSISLSRLLVPTSDEIVLEKDEPTLPFLRSSRAATPGRRVRGAAIRAFVQWYEGEVGPLRFRSLLSRLPHHVFNQLDVDVEGLGIQEGHWYADAIVEALLDALTGHLSQQRRGYVALRAARVMMRATLAGPYRPIFARLATPERYADHAQELWNAYYDSGTMRISRRSDLPGATCAVRDWHVHHPLLCGLNGGASTALYEAMGKRQVTTLRLACVSLGHRECVFSTTWRD